MYGFLSVVVFVFLFAARVDAAIAMPDFEVSAVEAIAGLMIAALAVVWVAEKVLDFVWRSTEWEHNDRSGF